MIVLLILIVVLLPKQTIDQTKTQIKQKSNLKVDLTKAPLEMFVVEKSEVKPGYYPPPPEPEPEPIVPSTPKYSYKSGVEQWRGLVSQYPWNVEEALLVMSKESGGNPQAVSRTADYGLFQIHNGLQTYGEKIFDPQFNTDLAYNHYYKNRGWKPWVAVKGILY